MTTHLLIGYVLYKLLYLKKFATYYINLTGDYHIMLLNLKKHYSFSTDDKLKYATEEWLKGQ